jgi:hypothetical protein
MNDHKGTDIATGGCCNEAINSHPSLPPSRGKVPEGQKGVGRLMGAPESNQPAKSVVSPACYGEGLGVGSFSEEGQWQPHKSIATALARS